MIYLAYFSVPIVLVVTMTLAVVTDPNVCWRMRARRPAERRGIALLRSWLTPEQTAQWDTRGAFRGGRLRYGTALSDYAREGHEHSGA
jgi:hypothetical protein